MYRSECQGADTQQGPTVKIVERIARILVQIIALLSLSLSISLPLSFSHSCRGVRLRADFGGERTSEVIDLARGKISETAEPYINSARRSGSFFARAIRRELKAITAASLSLLLAYRAYVHPVYSDSIRKPLELAKQPRTA